MIFEESSFDIILSDVWAHNLLLLSTHSVPSLENQDNVDGQPLSHTEAVDLEDNLHLDAEEEMNNTEFMEEDNNVEEGDSNDEEGDNNDEDGYYNDEEGNDYESNFNYDEEGDEAQYYQNDDQPEEENENWEQDVLQSGDG